jgi:hypothetical protein
MTKPTEVCSNCNMTSGYNMVEHWGNFEENTGTRKIRLGWECRECHKVIWDHEVHIPEVID